MAHKTSRKHRPTPLRDVQIAAHADRSRRYLILDADSSLSPECSVEQQGAQSTPLFSLHESHSAWQVRVPPSNSPPTCASPCAVDPLPLTPSLARVEPSVTLPSSVPNYRWTNSLDSRGDSHLGPVSLHPLQRYRSFTPPISPPMLSPPAQDAEYLSKRSGMTFALVPAEVDGKHVFTHVVVDRRGNDSRDNSGSSSYGEEGLPEDMQDILRQLDDLATWVKAASSSSRDRISNTKPIAHVARRTIHPASRTGRDSTNEPCPNKGKNRLLSTTPLDSEFGTRLDLVESSSALSGNPTNVLIGTDCRSEGFIYIPNCNTPEFLVGSSNSPIAYPVCGYSSHPPHFSPNLPGTTHNIRYHHRFLERQSAPCPPPTTPVVSPPSGKTSFKMLFQRSRCNSAAASRPSIPSSHVPVGGALRQGKRMRLPWLKI